MLIEHLRNAKGDLPGSDDRIVLRILDDVSEELLYHVTFRPGADPGKEDPVIDHLGNWNLKRKQGGFPMKHVFRKWKGEKEDFAYCLQEGAKLGFLKVRWSSNLKRRYRPGRDGMLTPAHRLRLSLSVVDTMGNEVSGRPIVLVRFIYKYSSMVHLTFGQNLVGQPMLRARGIRTAMFTIKKEMPTQPLLSNPVKRPELVEFFENGISFACAEEEESGEKPVRNQKFKTSFKQAKQKPGLREVAVAMEFENGMKGTHRWLLQTNHKGKQTAVFSFFPRAHPRKPPSKGFAGSENKEATYMMSFQHGLEKSGTFENARISSIDFLITGNGFNARLPFDFNQDSEQTFSHINVQFPAQLGNDGVAVYQILGLAKAEIVQEDGETLLMESRFTYEVAFIGVY